MAGVLAHVEDVTGRLTSKRVAHLDAHGDDVWLEGLWRSGMSYIEDVHPEAVPERPERDIPGGYLRPYFPHRDLPHLRQPVASQFLQGMTLRPHDFADARAIQSGSAVLCRHLLYCDSVAIDDPVMPILLGGVDDLRVLRARRIQVLAALNWLVRMRPLLLAERLVLVPFHISYWAIPQGEDDLVFSASRIPAEDFEGLRDFYPGPSDSKIDLLSMALYDMRIQTVTQGCFGQRLDYSTPHPLHDRAVALLAQGPEPPHRERVRTLATVPGIDVSDVDPEALVYLAAEDETFARWRIGVGRALSRIAGSRGSTDPAAHARSAFGEELYDSVAALANQARMHRWKGVIKERAEDISFGAVGAGTAAAASAALGVAVTPASIIALGGAGLSRMIWTYAKGRKARTRAAAVSELYDVLTRSPG